MNNYLATKNIKKISAFILTTSVLAGSVSPIFADGNTLKDEVVYVKLNNTGDVDNVYIVNSFDIKNGEKLVDYGDYTNVVNLSTNDILTYSNGLLDTKVSDLDRKFYYQGDVANSEIPWDIDIKYNLDGKSISAEDLAGKSGDLEISLNVDKNDNIDDVFFDNYALQISLTLDGDKCKDIIADGGTVASVGSNKSITFIKMAGDKASYTIKSNVENFEMDSISLNGVNMDMNVDIDVSEMTDPLDELVDAVEKLNDGANELNEGINSAKDGANELYNGSSQLENGVVLYKNGVSILDKGISSLQGGVNNYKKGVNSLYTNSQQLLAGSKQLDSGLEAYESGVNSLNEGAQSLDNGLYQLSQGSAEYKKNINEYANTINNIASKLRPLIKLIPQNVVEQLKLQDLINQVDALVDASQNLATAYESIDSGINSALAGSNAVSAGSGELASNIGPIRKGSSDLYSGIQAFASGSGELASGIDEIQTGTTGLKSGSSELVNGINEIQTGATGLKSGSSQLASGVNQLGSGSSELKDGTNQLNNETSKLPETIDEKIDEITSKYTNNDFKPVSFASENNTNVESVQFALRTDAIKVKEEEKNEEVKEEEASMWDKFINLFKKD